MEKVTGIGGVFFRAKDPSALQSWYAKHLGVEPPPQTYEGTVWHQEAGPTVFEAFAESAEFFGSPEQRWSINFRVRHIDAMVAQLMRAGIDVEVDPEVYPNGRFAALADRKHDGRRAEMAAAGDPSEPVRRSRPYAPGYGIPSHSRGMISWDHVQERMAAAGNYWVATVRPDGRPHATPVWGLWVDRAFYFGAGQRTRKWRNLAQNPNVAVHLESGEDVVILEGVA